MANTERRKHSITHAEAVLLTDRTWGSTACGNIHIADADQRLYEAWKLACEINTAGYIMYDFLGRFIAQQASDASNFELQGLFERCPTADPIDDIIRALTLAYDQLTTKIADQPDDELLKVVRNHVGLGIHDLEREERQVRYLANREIPDDPDTPIQDRDDVMRQAMQVLGRGPEVEHPEN